MFYCYYYYETIIIIIIVSSLLKHLFAKLLQNLGAKKSVSNFCQSLKKQ